MATAPNACFDYRRKCLQSVKHPWTYVPCENCRQGRENAIVSFKPEPDIESDVPAIRRKAWAKGLEALGYKHAMDGPPCPICKRKRPNRKNILPDKPCELCRHHSKEYAEKNRVRARLRYQKMRGA